jgi:site-specific recombinase XerD
VKKIGLVVFLSRWLEQNGIGLESLNEQCIADFTESQRELLSRRTQVQHTLCQLIQHLRGAGSIPSQTPSITTTEIDNLLEQYGEFLVNERGLSLKTLENYFPVARRILVRKFGAGELLLDRLLVDDINEFILHESSTFSNKRMQLITSALRSFLRFAHVRGHILTPLAAAVPAVANCGRSDLPRFLEPEQVRRILKSCDRGTACGRRDYAVLLLLARLGLRSGEITNLCLEDINWPSGEILIRGKSAREERLPLLADVGRAVVAYLQKDRPRCICRRVFLRMKAPHVGFSSSVAVTDILLRALMRTNIRAKCKGVQLLRNSLATRMLQRGASLIQIGQILRHELPQTTEIYVTVDFATLRKIAQPWPPDDQ